ncbi:MAG: peptide ABC transporter substrate-binding protein [Vulcanimicrobiaceae bacterium]
MHNRRLLRAALAALILAFAGCTKVGTANGGTPGPNPWTHPGRLVFAEGYDAKSLDPMLSVNAGTGDLSMFLFSYAVRYDEHARPVPDALREVPSVENGDVSRDGLTLRYKLRPNVYFHDGVQLTCRDLRFTWQAVMNPANNGVTQDGYRDVRDVDCSNPLVAVVHMKRVYAPFLQQLWSVNGNAAILPEHLLARVNDAKGSFNTASYQSAPVGSGPFQFVRWDRGSDVVLKAFDRFYLGKPKLREVVFKYVPDDTTMVEQLHTHEIDMALHLSSNVWPLLANVPGAVVDAPPIYTYDHIDFNLRRPLFADVALRRALALAVDRRSILRKIGHGLGDLTDTAQSRRLSWAWTPDTAHYDYDLGAAKALLERDGWRVGPGGIRVKDGQRLEFDYSTQTESASGKAIQTFIQTGWREVGADVTVKNAPTAQFFDNSPQTGILQGGHYDVAGFAWSGAADPDDSSIYSAHNFPPLGQNALFWNDPVATRAMDDELATVDGARRKRDFVIEQQRFASDVPSIVLYYRREPEAYNTDLKGYAPSPVISPFWDPWNYSI